MPRQRTVFDLPWVSFPNTVLGHMKPTIFHVRFTSSDHDFGDGIAVLKDGAVNGGDKGFVWFGACEVSGTEISARLTCRRWNPAVPSVFGNYGEFQLNLKGTVQPDFSRFSISGPAVGLPGSHTITITGNKVADAA